MMLVCLVMLANALRHGSSKPAGNWLSRLSMCLAIDPSTCLSVCLSIYPSIHPSIYLSLSTGPSKWSIFHNFLVLSTRKHPVIYNVFVPLASKKSF